MYPRGELDELGTRKALVQARIAVRRLQCAEHAMQVAGPLRVIDRVREKWHHISPWVKLVGIPLGVIAGRKMEKRGHEGKMSMLLKYAPIALQVVKLLTKARENAKLQAKALAESQPGV